MTDQHMTPDSDERKARFEALLALALDDAPAPLRPSDNDIAAWIDGRLHGAEAEAVQSWVARSPEGYALWTSMPPPVAATPATNTVVSLTSASRRSRARTITRTLIPAALAAAVLVAVVPHGPASLDERIDILASDLDSPITLKPPAPIKGLGLAGNVDRVAYAAGVKMELMSRLQQQADWKAWLDRLPDLPQTPCATGADQNCKERVALMQSAGRWSALTMMTCRGNSPDRAALPVAYVTVADDLSKQLLALDPKGFAASTAGNLKNAAGDAQALCSLALRQISALP